MIGVIYLLLYLPISLDKMNRVNHLDPKLYLNRLPVGVNELVTLWDRDVRSRVKYGSPNDSKVRGEFVLVVSSSSLELVILQHQDSFPLSLSLDP